MKRMRNIRKYTEALVKDAVASNVISQKWGKEMADAWRAANSELLEFKEQRGWELCYRFEGRRQLR